MNAWLEDALAAREARIVELEEQLEHVQWELRSCYRVLDAAREVIRDAQQPAADRLVGVGMLMNVEVPL